MKSKLVSIIFPSRGRYESVAKLLSSIEEKTFDKNRIEVIAICDHDDKETAELFIDFAKRVSYDFKFVSRKRKEKLDLPNDYYDLGLRLATDAYFTWILGNDCEIKTENWDENLYQALNDSLPDWQNYIEKNEKFFYVKINDDTHWNEDGVPQGHAAKYGDQSCCFPLLSSNYCHASGEFYPKEVPLWGGDTLLYLLICNSNKAIQLDAVGLIGIRHYSIHNNRSVQDDISKKLQAEHLSNQIIYRDRNIDPWEVPETFKQIIEKRKSFL